MYYTLNGNVPTQADPVATNGQTLVIYGTATLNVDAFAAGSAPSGVNSAAFTITGAIAAGDKFTLGLRYNGGVLAAGTNYTGQLGDGTLSNRLAWVTVSNLTSGVTAISAGTNFSVALLTNGTVRAWGYNASGQLGDGTTTTRTTNVLVTNLTSVAAIAAGGSHSLALLSNGVVRAWGYNGSGQLGDGTTTTRITNVLVTNLTSVVAIAAGGMHSLALSNGYVRAWGYNGSGQLGDGTTTTRTTNVLATNLTSVAAIAAGGSHSLALLSNGVVRAWGLNNGGQLGDGTTINRSTNVLVTNLTSVVAIAAGTSHSLALLSNGTVMAWGTNNFGQLGDGTTNQYRLTPVLVTNLSNVVAVACGFYHSLALQSNGRVTAWGTSTNSAVIFSDDGVDYGQSVVPAGLTNVVAIAGGGWHSLALKADGTVAGWGDVQFGQADIPPGMSNVVAIAAGAADSLVLKADGTLVDWGDNTYGQTNIPPGLSNVVAIASGGWHHLALKSNGTVAAWGAGVGADTNVDFGQSSIPAGLTNVVRIAAGSVNSLALVGAGPPVLKVPLTVVGLKTNGFTGSLPTENGRVYQLESVNSLTNPVWSAFPLQAGSGGTLRFNDPTPTGAQRFYRVNRW